MREQFHGHGTDVGGIIFCFLLRLSTSNTLTLQLLTLIQSYTIYLRLLTLASAHLILQYFRLVPLVGWRAEERDVWELAGLIGEVLQLNWIREGPAKERQPNIFI